MKKILPASLSLSRQERLIHRDKMIEKMTAEDKECLGIIHWTLVYDFEIASITTNLAQLKEIGYETFTTEQWISSNFTHSEQDAILKQLFDGLSKINIYLLTLFLGLLLLVFFFSILIKKKRKDIVLIKSI